MTSFLINPSAASQISSRVFSSTDDMGGSLLSDVQEFGSNSSFGSASSFGSDSSIKTVVHHFSPLRPSVISSREAPGSSDPSPLGARRHVREEDDKESIWEMLKNVVPLILAGLLLVLFIVANIFMYNA